MTRNLIIILIALYPFFLFPKGGGDLLKELNDKCIQASTQRQKVESYLELAFYYRSKEFDHVRADSIYQLAINIAELSLDDDLMFEANKFFLENIPLEYENENCKRSCARLVAIANDYPKEHRLFEAYYVYGKACLILVGCDDAKDIALKAFRLATKNDLIDQLIKANLLLGQVYADELKLADAFSHYSEARLRMEELSDKNKSKAEFQYEYHGHMFKLYMAINNYDKALEHNQKQMTHLLSTSPIDSLKLMWLKLDLGDYYTKKTSNIYGLYEEILEYAIKTEHKTLKNYCLSKYRTWLIENTMFKELKVLMVDRFPESLIRDWNFTIMAHIQEGMGNMDSTIFYFNRNEELLESSSNKYLKAHSFMRFGEFYNRQNDIIKAKEKFINALHFAKNEPLGGNLLIDILTYLEAIALKESDYKAAYQYFKLCDSLYKINFNIEKHNELTELRVLSDEQRKIRIEEIEQETTRKKHQAQYFWIVIIILIIGVILIALSNMSVPEWLIEMMSFFSVLSVFEFFILIMDKPIHDITQGEPIWNFFIKILIFSILFPLHHIIESSMTEYLKKNKVIVKPGSFTFRRTLAKIWPWLSDEKQVVDQA